jgi:hypothetical protein
MDVPYTIDFLYECSFQPGPVSFDGNIKSGKDKMKIERLDLISTDYLRNTDLFIIGCKKYPLL